MEFSRAARGLVALALLLAASHELLAANPAEKYALQAEHQAGELTRVEVSLQVGGDLTLANEGSQKKLAMSVVANLIYGEKLLAAGTEEKPARAIRYYDAAQAVIKVDKGGEKPTLATDRRLIAVEKPRKGPTVLYCPTAPLKREELDLIDVPGNTLVLDQVLPTNPVTLGESWKLADQTLADLIGLEAVSWTDVQSVFGQITDGVAEIASAGSVSGAVGGVSTEIEMKAKYKFDLKLKRIVYFALLIKEKRPIGHIGPGLDTVAKLIVEIGGAHQNQHLTETSLAKVPKTLTPQLAQLGFESASRQFRFHYDRRWYITSDEPKLTVFRLMDRGELVAQCNVATLPGGQKKPVSLAEFQQDVQQTLGKNFGQFINASESTNEAGYTLLRVVVRGTVSQLPIEWIYYLIADSKNQRVSLAFTLEQSLEERFAQADRVLVSELRLTEPTVPTAARTTRQK
ncbi:MAG: hypothetical protein HY288_05040 [Planctomycetia bacterium]|nr:hypothetical protein [Planctomycetia bacterium]